MKHHTVIAADRSMLAANMYRLLFAPLGCTVVAAASMDELTTGLRRQGGAELVLMSSNIFAGRFERAMGMMEKDSSLAVLPKIFLCRAQEIEKGWGERLAVLPNAEIVERPFHPDVFTTHVRKLLEGEE